MSSSVEVLLVSGIERYKYKKDTETYLPEVCPVCGTRAREDSEEHCYPDYYWE